MSILLNQNVDFFRLKALANGQDPQKVLVSQGAVSKPKVYLIAAISKDGYIAQSHKDTLKWVPREDKLWYREKTIQIGNLIIGRKTYEMLPKRAKEKRVYYIYSHNFDKGVALRPNDGNYNVNIDPADLLNRLHNKGVKQVAIVGGAQIYDMFLEYDLVDVMYLSVIDVMLGKLNEDNYLINSKFLFELIQNLTRSYNNEQISFIKFFKFVFELQTDGSYASFVRYKLIKATIDV